MSNCNKCEALTEKWGDGTRWSLVNEIQVCICKSPAEVSEVDVQDAVQIASYCCEEHALEALSDYLQQINAVAQWSDIGPIETCACCQADLDTTRPHRVIVLSRDVIDGDDVQEFDVQYPARLCNKCEPCQASDSAAKTHMSVGG